MRMMITSAHVYLLSALMTTSSIFQHIDARASEQVIATRRGLSLEGQVPTKKPTHGGTQPPNLQLMTFNMNITEEQIVSSLIAENGDVEIDMITANGILPQCAALYSGGHSLGKLMQRGPGPDYALLTDDNGNYIPSDTYIAPDNGIILSSGDPRRFNWNDGDMDTIEHSTSQSSSTWVSELREDIFQQSRVKASFYDACAISFRFRCKSNGYVPRVSFKYSFGSEEYYEYVNSQFNDAFGFYLNGINIATLPSSSTDSSIVAINNVNYDVNKGYFNGNDPGQNEHLPGHPDSEIVYPHLEADGFTNILTAMGEPNPDPLAWNTMKLIVADVATTTPGCPSKWVAGATYVAGSLVSMNDASGNSKILKCKSTAAMPTLDKLCNQVGYEPYSTTYGGAWAHAWEVIGPCSGTITPLTAIRGAKLDSWVVLERDSFTCVRYSDGK